MLHARRTALREQSDRGRDYVRTLHNHARYADQVAILASGN
jgi:hypothetical protein